MKCKNCGYENSDDSRFCLKCGTGLTADTEPKKTITEKEDGTDKISETDKSVNLSTYSSHKNRKLIAAASAAAVVIAVGAAAFGSMNKADDTLASEETVTSTSAETSASTESVTSATTAKTTVTTKQTTTAATTSTAAATPTVTTKSETVPIKSNAAKYSLSCGSIEVVDNNEFILIDDDLEYNSNSKRSISYYQLIPYVNINNYDVSKKIQNALDEILSLSDQINYKSGTLSDTLPIAYCGFGSETYEKSIDSVYEENGLIFITVVYYADMGGGTSLSVYAVSTTYIFDSATGDQYTIDDFITDRKNFEYYVDQYIDSIAYSEIDSPDYYSYYRETLETNDWIKGEWIYDGNNLTVSYHYLTGGSSPNKNSDYSVPKNVWERYLEFSLSALDKKSEIFIETSYDSFGKKIMSGNTAGNYGNGSRIAYDDDFIYGRDNESQNLKVISVATGTTEYILDDMTDYMLSAGEKIFYRNLSDGKKLYCINKDKTERKAITQNEVSLPKIYNDYIYYIDENSLFRIDMNGTNKVSLINNVSDFQIYDDKIYCKSENDVKIEVYDLTGNDITCYVSYSPKSKEQKEIDRFFVTDGYIILANPDFVNIFNIYGGNGRVVQYSDKKIKGINEDPDNFIIAVGEQNGSCSIYTIPKYNIENENFAFSSDNYCDLKDYPIYTAQAYSRTIVYIYNGTGYKGEYL